MTTSRRLLVLLALVVVLAGACSADASRADLKQPQFDGNVNTNNITAKAMDKIEVLVNVDNSPNVVRFCIDGQAYMTISKDYNVPQVDPFRRMPEWDKSFCGTEAK